MCDLVENRYLIVLFVGWLDYFSNISSSAMVSENFVFQMASSMACKHSSVCLEISCPQK